MGDSSSYVRNIEANPRVRVKVGRGAGAPGRPPWFLAKIRARGSERSPAPDRRRGFTPATVRLMQTELLTVRVDLDPEG